MSDANFTSIDIQINTTEETSIESHDTNATVIIGIWITGIICLLGLAGNILSFIVLLKAHHYSPMFFVLRAVALSDAAFLLCVFTLQVTVNIYPYTGEYARCFDNRGWIQFVIWPIMMMTQMSTVWLTVLVSIERYIAVCFPFKAARLCTMTNVRRSVIIIYISSIIYNLPRYAELQVTEGQTLQKSPIGENKIYRYTYNSVLYSLTLFLVPLVSLIFMNVRLVMSIKQGKKQWETLQFRQKKEQNLTIIPLTIVLVFFLCGVPSLIVNIIDSINADLFMEFSYHIFMIVSNLLVVINSATNFIIYCFLGKKFRSKLQELFHCKQYHVIQNAVRMTAMVNSQL